MAKDSGLASLLERVARLERRQKVTEIEVYQGLKFTPGGAVQVAQYQADLKRADDPPPVFTQGERVTLNNGNTRGEVLEWDASNEIAVVKLVSGEKMRCAGHELAKVA